MQFTDDFFKEEVSWGYTVTSARKRYWAELLKMLELVDHICNKYHLKYFASGGTLLGAIRHKGFIPWDYDVDVNMMRNDYEIFCKVAQAELPSPYFLQTAYTDNYPVFYAKIRNSATTAGTKHSIGLGFNNGIFMDIFPIDKMPDDMSLYDPIREEVKKLDRFLKIGVQKYWYLGNEKITDEEKKEVFDYINEHGWKRRFIEVENMYRQFNVENTEKCGYISMPVFHGFLYDCSDYEESMYVPFENIMIPVPKTYDKLLTLAYGDYMTPDKAHAEARPLLVSTKVPYYEFDPERDAEDF